mmetsp:Transcript_59325/g.165646  ORF Transcript_59325/g.165646 Transcript_59325/m.165646 type:complete len:288 (-) Transcript_59325:164-1027(-)|eukprot:CAMPEP_0117508746 /NCGR_PEP_ID=MMETSP0784-20121206/27110_1 /TAXON_ID=39447 /ORGANISM="" /LENGTH=287 /DNA_ID=CAMNT_0005304315 /DNA_START=312 /DNA_END=1175 /DNA_ORIENTATION=-
MKVANATSAQEAPVGFASLPHDLSVILRRIVGLGARLPVQRLVQRHLKDPQATVRPVTHRRGIEGQSEFVFPEAHHRQCTAIPVWIWPLIVTWPSALNQGLHLLQGDRHGRKRTWREIINTRWWPYFQAAEPAVHSQSRLYASVPTTLRCNLGRDAIHQRSTLSLHIKAIPNDVVCEVADEVLQPKFRGIFCVLRRSGPTHRRRRPSAKARRHTILRSQDVDLGLVRRDLVSDDFLVGTTARVKDLRRSAHPTSSVRLEHAMATSQHLLHLGPGQGTACALKCFTAA